MRRFILIVVIAVIGVSFVVLGYAGSAVALTEERAGLISMTCGSIRLQLEKLQRDDSRVRVYLGSKYETVLSGYITNLNLRLVKQNLATTALTDSQTTFNNERNFFKSAFTDYSKSLDGLKAVDCKSDPYAFYDKLEETRQKREVVRASFLRLGDVLGEHREEVVGLKERL